jgi:alkylation response protein AidB-like acyl-CoA dehydrogenase
MTPQAVAAGTGHAFDLTEDQQAVRDMVRDFAESEIRPIAAKIDETHEFPAETTRKMGELGLLGMFVPESYGGAGMDYLSYVIAVEELSRVCASHGVICSVNNSLVSYPILAYGTEAAEAAVSRAARQGRAARLLLPHRAERRQQRANQQTTATRDGDDYVLNGTKMFITTAGPADVLIVYAATDRSLGAKGISAFIVDATTPGVTKGKKELKLGIHASDTREIAFQNARVPAANLLGEHNKGYTVALATLGGGRIGIAAQALGIAQAAVEASGEVRERARAVRPQDRRVRRDPPDARGQRDRARHRAAARLPRGMAARSGPPARQGGVARQVARLGGRDEVRELGDPGARRLRLSRRVQRRALLARCAHHRDLRRHDGSPEDGRRGAGAEGAPARLTMTLTRFGRNR